MDKKTGIKFGLSMLAYTAAIFLMSDMREDYQGTLMYWGLTILPMVPTAYAGVVVFKGVLAMDELMRRIHVEAIVFSAFVTGFITFSWSLMSNAGLPELPAIWVLPMLIALWGVGLVISTIKYR